MRASRAMLLLLAVLAAWQAVHYYQSMPETMAAHFDAAGRPDGYQSRRGFFVLSGVLIAGAVLLFAGMAPLLRRLPSGWINLPHREYWLASERREETIDSLGHQMEWFGVATLALLVATLQLVFQANHMAEPRLDSSTMWWLLGGYSTRQSGSCGWCDVFRKPSRSAAQRV